MAPTSLISMMISNLRKFSFVLSPIDEERFKAYYLEDHHNETRTSRSIDTNYDHNEEGYSDETVSIEHNDDSNEITEICDQYNAVISSYRSHLSTGSGHLYEDDIDQIFHEHEYYNDSDDYGDDDDDDDDINVHHNDNSSEISGSKSSINNCQNDNKFQTLLYYPWKFTKLLKQETMSRNGFAIYYLFLGSLFQTHMLIKSLVQLFWVGRDKDREIYLNSLCYSSLMGASDQSAKYQAAIISHILFNYIFWHLNLYNLIRKSVINRNNYTAISLSQINLAYLASFQWKFFTELRNTFLAIFKYPIMASKNNDINHTWENAILKRFAIKSTQNCTLNYPKQLCHVHSLPVETIQKEAPFAFHDPLDHSGLNVRKNWLKYMIFVENPIDYTANFEIFKSKITKDQQESFFKLDNPHTNSRAWQVAKPMHRINVDRLGLVMFIIQNFISTHMIGCAFYLSGLIGLELISNDLAQSKPNQTSSVKLSDNDTLILNDNLAISYLNLIKPYKIIRLTENLIFYLTLLVPQSNSILFCIDGLIVVSRVENVSRLAKHQVELMINATTHNDRKQRNWSAQMRHLVQLIQLLACEFNYVKTEHIVSIHLLIISGCIVVPQVISLILISGNIWETAILVGALINSLIPILTIVPISAFAELFVSEQFKQCNFILNKSDTN